MLECLWFWDYYHHPCPFDVSSREPNRLTEKRNFLFYLSKICFELFKTSGSMSQPLKLFMQSLVFFYRGRGWENQRVSSPRAVKRCLQGAREVEQVSAELGSDKGSLKPSLLLPAASCCLLKESLSPNTEHNNPIECLADDKLCTDKQQQWQNRAQRQGSLCRGRKRKINEINSGRQKQRKTQQLD